jgi:3-oxocholest-4-en-26-oyl-CoA dehydrogenase beta subunit
MDFKTTEAADDLGGLARTITESVCTPEHQRELDGLELGVPPAQRAGGRFDRDLWAKLIEADILSAAMPEAVGGGGFGVLEQVAVLTALGRQLAAVPYLDSVVLGAGALAKFGSRALQQEWAVPAINGDQILAVALDGEMGQGPVRATKGGSGYKLTGSRTLVDYGPVADGFLIPAETDSGTKVFLVAASDAGMTVSALNTTGHGSEGHLELQGVEVAADRVVGDEVGAPPACGGVVAWLTTHATLGRSAFQLGVLERALELTAAYAREREQFDRPIGSFQAVSSRLADGYIDIKGLRLTLTQAAWRLSEDLPADIDVASAAFWAADAGHRVAHTAVHVHGGVGIDTDHPVHRYFLAAKQTEFAVGSATGQLLRIGRELADTPA